jgi:hypothetical protein
MDPKTGELHSSPGGNGEAIHSGQVAYELPKSPAVVFGEQNTVHFPGSASVGQVRLPVDTPESLRATEDKISLKLLK